MRCDIRIAIILAGITLSSCTDITIDMPKGTEKGPGYAAFSRNRKECNLLAEKFCPYPITKYCTLDAYEKRVVFIKNCMYERGWRDPYNALSYYR